VLDAVSVDFIGDFAGSFPMTLWGEIDPERNRFNLQQALSKIAFANSVLPFARQRILIEIYRLQL
jgi:hypothetical protein